MQLLQKNYIDWRIQRHLKGLKLPQTRKKLTHEELVKALEKRGSIQSEEAPDEENVFPWPLKKANAGGSTSNNDNSNDREMFYLSHCNLRFFYICSGMGWRKKQLCISIGLFATFICSKEKPDALAEEIQRIDTQLIPQWTEDFHNLSPDEITDLATKEFAEQMEILRGKPAIFDTQSARIFAVPVTEVRQKISRNKALFTEDAAFHLNFEEMRERSRKCLNPPKFRKRDYRPYALTEQGFCLLSMQLSSQIAIKMHISIIQTVSANVPLREMLEKLRGRE